MKKSKLSHLNKKVYSPLFLLLKKTTNLTKIRKELKISKQNLNNQLRRLEREGYIKKISRGYYEVNFLTSNTLPKEVNFFTPNTPKKQEKEIRGHAFIWTIKTRKIDWFNKLKKSNLDYKLVRKATPRIFINNRKVWLGKKTIVIYESHSFYGRTAVESRKYAVVTLLEILEALESRLQVNLKPYIFKPAREHYGIIKNDLARQCNRNNEKIKIRDDLEGEWLWIDDSESLGELETGGPKAMTRNIQVQKWWNNMKETKFEVTPKFILQSIGGLIETQVMNSKNIVKHQKVLDEMLITLKLIQGNLHKL